MSNSAMIMILIADDEKKMILRCFSLKIIYILYDNCINYFL